MRSSHSIEGTLAYCTPSALDAAHAQNRRPWTEFASVLGARSVALM